MKNFRSRILSVDYGKRFRLLLAAGLCILIIGGGASAILLHTVDANALGGSTQIEQENSAGRQPPGTAQPYGGHGRFGNDGKQHLPDQNSTPDTQEGNGASPENGANNDNNTGNSNNSSKSGNTSQDANTTGAIAQVASYQQTAGGNMGSMGNMGGGFDGVRMDGRGGHHGHFLSMILHNNQISIVTKIVILATTILGILWLLAVWYTIVCYLYRSSTFSRMNRTLWTILGIFGGILALLAFFIARSILKVRCENCDAWQDAEQAYCTDCGAALQQNCPGCGASVSQNAAYCPSCGKEMAADNSTNP